MIHLAVVGMVTPSIILLDINSPAQQGQAKLAYNMLVIEWGPLY